MIDSQRGANFAQYSIDPIPNTDITKNVFDTFWNFVLTSFRYANTVHRSADANTETSDFVIDCVRANSMVSGLN